MLPSRDRKTERRFELATAVGVKLRRERLARREQGVPRPDRVVDLVSHHADELFERGPLRAMQLLAELVDQEEAARKA